MAIRHRLGDVALVDLLAVARGLASVPMRGLLKRDRNDQPEGGDESEDAMCRERVRGGDGRQKQDDSGDQKHCFTLGK